MGTPDTVLSMMQPYIDAGVTRFELRVSPGDIPAEMAAQTIRLAGQHIIPRFQ